MPDMRLPYSPGRSDGGDTYVVGPDNERVCTIPAKARPWLRETRSEAECWSVAQLIARLLNDESDRCRTGADAINVKDLAK